MGEDRSKGDAWVGDIPVKRPSEATSTKTLNDIEETQKDSGSGTNEQQPEPAPDGQFDERSDEGDDAGPM